MKFAAAALVLFAGLVAPIASAQENNRADTGLDNRAEVLANADAFDNAQRTQNRAELERILAPEYRLVHGSGRIGDKEDFISAVVDPANHITAVEVANRTYTPLGRDAAIVGGEGTIRGADANGAFSEHFQFADTFVHRDGHWVVVYTQVTMLPAQTPAPQPAAH